MTLLVLLTVVVASAAFFYGYKLGCSDTKLGMHMALFNLKASIDSDNVEAVEVIAAIDNMLSALKLS